jgi:hypothetical protein
MPEGIIRDPRQNPRERRYGILYSATYRGYLAYDKINKNNARRWWIGGLRVHYNFIEDLPARVNYDGVEITHKVDDDITLLDAPNAHPVYKKIFDKINGDKQLFKGIDTDVPDEE